jgi:hypothetical protein
VYPHILRVRTRPAISASFAGVIAREGRATQYSASEYWVPRLHEA